MNTNKNRNDDTVTKLVKLIYNLLEIYNDEELYEPTLTYSIVQENLTLDFPDDFDDFKTALLTELDNIDYDIEL